MTIAAALTPKAAARRLWVDHAHAVIRAAGHRSSAPRSAVVATLATQNCVRSAGEIGDSLRREGTEIGIATVYRALELLDDLGLVQRLDVGEGSARFEPALPTGEHHHHVVCDRCGRVSQFEDEGLEAAIDRVARRLEYRVGAHDVILRGACPDCASA